MSDRLYAVTLGNGIVVWHTDEQYQALFLGVDRAAAQAHNDTITLEVQRYGPAG